MTTTYAPGQSVRDRKWGGGYTGTVVNVEGGSVYVQWHGTCVEDQMDPGEIVPAPDVPTPDGNGLRLLEVFPR
jgi:hypothetical protein